MKKLVLIVSILVLSASGAFAGFENYYNFESNLDVTFIQSSEPNNKTELKEYKKILKNEKYIKQKKYQKADKLLPDYIPNIARFINVYTDYKDYKNALECAKQLEKLDTKNLFPKASKDYRLGILYSLNGDYINSNTYLYPYVETNSYARFQIAQNYYYMQDLKSAETYAAKINAKDDAFYPAQELLYSIFEITKNPQKAYTIAKNLVKLDPGNPLNYMRIADSTTNNAEKLTNYYRAKQIYHSQNLNDMIKRINNLTAPIEQEKIDNAYKKLTSYCKKPDWFKIRERNGNLLSNDIGYWDKRQSEFFNSANDCISRYTGSNLAACFNDLNSTQEREDSALAAESARRIEAKQREIQIEQLIRQNMLLEEQNRIQRYYNDYPRYYYYRRPYWW